MVIERIKELLGKEKTKALKDLLGIERVEAIKDLVESVNGVISGEYKSPREKVKSLEKRLSVRGKDFKKLTEKIRSNNIEMAKLDKKLSAMEEQLISNIFDHAQAIPEEEQEDEEKFPEMEMAFDVSKYLKKSN